MVKIIRRILLMLFPELLAGLHLPIFAVVVGVRETPAAGDVCDDFRPFYAVDVQILNEYGEPDTAKPVLKDVILSLPVAGHEMGCFAYPENGTWVEIAFAYGSPNRPFIRSVLPHGLTLPTIERGEQRWQHHAEAFQRVDENGNWQRHTDQVINDKSLTRLIEAMDVVENFHRSVKNTETSDSEFIGAIKRIEAFGAVVVQSGGVLDLSAIDKLRLTTKADLVIRAIGNLVSTIGGSKTENITGNVQETIGGTKTEDITGDHTITTPQHTVNGKTSLNGDLDTTGKVDLDGGGFPIVTTGHICPFLGSNHVAGSTTCQAKA